MSHDQNLRKDRSTLASPIDLCKAHKKMSSFQKPYRPHVLGAYSKIYIIFNDKICIIFNNFCAFPTEKKKFQKKIFAYLPTLKNIEMFRETRHLFFCLNILLAHPAHALNENMMLSRIAQSVARSQRLATYMYLCQAGSSPAGDET